jgi:hypothetical protein
MIMANTAWRVLLADVNTDDSAAVADRRQEIEDHLGRIVRRQLRRRRATDDLGRRILALAREVAEEYPEESRDREWLIDQVTGSVSRSVLAEAPAPFGGQALIATVCA